MTKRLFTFGCSFTHYRWPTWANIMGQEFDQFENWGKSGGGNHLILYSLIEAVQRKNIGADDTIAIMFTSVGREDRWLRGEWYTPGSIYNSDLDEKYIQHFTDPTGFYLTNLTVIDSIVKILQHIGCHYHLMSTVPFSTVDDSFLKKIFKLKKDVASQVNDLYQSSLQQINSSVFEIIFNSDWDSRSDFIIPIARLDALDLFKKRYNECAGKDWPQFENFIENNTGNISKHILKEIDVQFNFFTWRQNINNCRQDHHPIPLEHLEYLKKIGFHITDRQQNFAQHWNQCVLSEEKIEWVNPAIERF